MKNPLCEALGKGEFTVTVEVVTPERAKPLDETLAPERKLSRGLAARVTSARPETASASTAPATASPRHPAGWTSSPGR